MKEVNFISLLMVYLHRFTFLSIHELKVFMMDVFDMMNLGLHYFLSSKIFQDDKGILIPQMKYAWDLLKNSHTQNFNVYSSSMNTS